jgi:anti-anti-sigma factor
MASHRPHWQTEMIKAVSTRYRRAPRAEKTRLLDEFCAVTGYHRKYALILLRRPPRPTLPGRPGRPRLYAGGLDRLLAGAWRAMGFPGAKRLKAELPRWLPWIRERFGATRRIEVLLLAMSPRTIDRRLKPFRLRWRQWEEGVRVQRQAAHQRILAASRQRGAGAPPPAAPAAAGPVPAGPETRRPPRTTVLSGTEASAKLGAPERFGSTGPGSRSSPRRNAGMDINMRKQKGVTIISVEGSMVMADEGFPIMKRVVKELKTGQKYFVIDLGKVEKMDSAGVGELVAINVAVKEKGGKFHMANFDEKIGKIIQMALIHKLIPTFDTQKDALAALEEDGAGE